MVTTATSADAGTPIKPATRGGVVPDPYVATYVLVFFTAMVLHELALEATNRAFVSSSTLLPDTTGRTSAITLFQFGWCFLLPLLASRGEAVRTLPRTVYQAVPYFRVSLVVFGATALATASLAYVSYPTKVVFKSAKLIPTMIVSTVMGSTGGSSTYYGPLDYLAAALLCVGAAGYSYNSSSAGSGSGDGDGPSDDSGGNGDSYYGVALLTVSILCDALVPNMQQRLMAPPPPMPKAEEYLPVRVTDVATTDTDASSPVVDDEDDDGRDGKSSAQQQHTTTPAGGLSPSALMVNVNGVGFACLLISMVANGSLVRAVAAVRSSPVLLAYLTVVGLALSTAVLAYTKLIRSAGPVVAVAVATLRKVATVVLSYVVFPKPVLPVHVASGLIVLLGIGVSAVSKQRGGVSSPSGKR